MHFAFTSSSLPALRRRPQLNINHSTRPFCRKRTKLCATMGNEQQKQKIKKKYCINFRTSLQTWYLYFLCFCTKRLNIAAAQRGNNFHSVCVSFGQFQTVPGLCVSVVNANFGEHQAQINQGSPPTHHRGGIYCQKIVGEIFGCHKSSLKQGAGVRRERWKKVFRARMEWSKII